MPTRETWTCSPHVSVSCDRRSPTRDRVRMVRHKVRWSSSPIGCVTISKVVCFVNDPDNAPLIRAVARRYSTGYCRVERKRLASAHQSDGNRYQAVNLCNAHTLEFRIFRGSLHAPAVIAAVEFANAVVEFCQPFGPDGFNLKAPAFLDFINTAAMRKHTRYLRAYLADRYPTACREAGLCDPALPADFVPVMMR